MSRIDTEGMMPDREVRLSDMEEPPHDITITIRDTLDSLRSRIASSVDDVPPLLVADLDGRRYPVGNIDTLRAAREAGLDRVPCVMIAASSMNRIAELHVIHSATQSYNPVAFLKLVRQMKKSGADLGVVPSAYRQEYDFATGVEERLDQFARQVGDTADDAQSLTPMLYPLSRVTRARQLDALNAVIKYCTFDRRAVPPDAHMLKSILGQYHGVRTRPELPGSVPAGDEAGAARTGPAPDDKAGDAEIRVREGDNIVSDAPTRSSAIRFECRCGASYVVSLESGTVREMVEGGSSITAVEVDSDTIYALGREDSEWLELAMSPVLHTHRLGSLGRALVITTRMLPKRILQDIARTVK